MTSEHLILVADQNREMRVALGRALSEAGYRTAEAGDGPYALRQAFADPPAAVVLNLSIPLLSGIELVKVLRAASDMAIIVVAENHSSALAVRVLEAGADDFVAASVNVPELVARIRATIRRAQRVVSPAPRYDSAEADLVHTGPVTIDLAGHLVFKRGEEVPMTRIEYLLLAALGQRLGQVAPHRLLLTDVWGAEYLDDTHYLRGYIASLRNKLEDDPSKPRLLLTEWGVGYRLANLPPEEHLRPAEALDSVLDEVDELIRAAG